MPPMLVAVVMVLQRIEGCSDREAVDRSALMLGGSMPRAGWVSAIRVSCTPYGERAGPVGGFGGAGPDLRRGPSGGQVGGSDRAQTDAGLGAAV